MLRRWTAWHGEWKEDVGSIAVETSDGLAFIDPLDPPADLGPPDHVLVTVFWHGRGSSGLGAKHVWASGPAVNPSPAAGSP
jgi:hypothetical protein